MYTLDAAAEWFLRLNGFFTVQNFVIHPVTAEDGTLQRTDADVLGIRFPDRREVVTDAPLVDHPAFQDAARPVFVIAEVKAGNCRLNGPWKHPERENVINVLRSFGKMSVASHDEISKALYENGHFQGVDLDARLLCFGSTRSRELPQGILQFTWEEVLGFIYDRYGAFRRVKKDHQQWPAIGSFLWDQSKGKGRTTFVAEMLKAFGVAEAMPPNV